MGRRERMETCCAVPVNPNATIYLYGQEVNPETWAVSKSDLFIKDPTGRDADSIAFGTTLSNDAHAARSFRLPHCQSAVWQGLEARREFGPG